MHKDEFALVPIVEMRDGASQAGTFESTQTRQ